MRMTDSLARVPYRSIMYLFRPRMSMPKRKESARSLSSFSLFAEREKKKQKERNDVGYPKRRRTALHITSASNWPPNDFRLSPDSLAKSSLLGGRRLWYSWQ